jgi:hypothetical protein
VFVWREIQDITGPERLIIKLSTDFKLGWKSGRNIVACIMPEFNRFVNIIS